MGIYFHSSGLAQWYPLTNRILCNLRDLQLAFSPLGIFLFKTQTPCCEKIWEAMWKGPHEEEQRPLASNHSCELPNGSSTTCQPCEWACSWILWASSSCLKQRYLKHSQASHEHTRGCCFKISKFLCFVMLWQITDISSSPEFPLSTRGTAIILTVHMKSWVTS